MRFARLICLFSLFSYPLNLAAAPPEPRVARSLPGKGIVTSSEANAARVGADILAQGGNAVDAAIAVGFAMAVTYPQAGNIGGGGFMVLRLADGRKTALDFRERAPYGAYANMYQDGQGNVIARSSLDGFRAAGTPGTVAGFWEAHQKFGKLPWKLLVQPAVRLARDGFPVTDALADSLKREKRLGFQAESQRIFLNSGMFYKKGDILRQPDLANTLWAIAQTGRDGFYSGPVSEKLVKAIRDGGGYIGQRDLAEYKAVFREPLVASYRQRYKIITMPPPSSGGIALLNMFGQMERFASAGSEPKPARPVGSADLHRRVEAMRRAFADRAFYLGDPDFVKVPTKELASHEYAVRRGATIDDNAATPSSEVRAGDPFPSSVPNESPQTTHYSTADGEGNVVAVTYTLNTAYGAAVVAKGTGILLNNEMDDFAAKPGVPNGFGLIQSAKNAIAPGKRPLSSMTPTIVLRDGKPYLIVGSPGGPTIINSVFQVISNVLDFGMSLPDAVKHGRIHHQWLPDEIAFEAEGVTSEQRKKLEGRGHRFAATQRRIGDVQAIVWDANSDTWIGVSDGRARDGLAAPQR